MLEFLRLRASRHVALDGDGEEDGAQLLDLSVWLRVPGFDGKTVEQERRLSVVSREE
jgi:hypothetical protein